MKLLIGAGASTGGHALIAAAVKNNTEAVKVLIAAKANLNETDGSHGNTALTVAASQGNAEIAKALIDAGADVNLRELQERGVTALLFAVSGGHIDVVRLLLKGGADVDAHTMDGVSALMSAAALGRPELVKLLIEAGADVNARDAILGRTPLMLAAVNPTDAAPEIIAWLLEQGEELEARDGEGRTALVCAVRYNSSPLAARALIEAGADTRARFNGNALRRLLRFNNRMSERDKKTIVPLLKGKSND